MHTINSNKKLFAYSLRRKTTTDRSEEIVFLFRCPEACKSILHRRNRINARRCPLDDHSIATRSVGRSHRQCPFDGQSNEPIIQIKLIIGDTLTREHAGSFIESKYKFPSFLAAARNSKATAFPEQETRTDVIQLIWSRVGTHYTSVYWRSRAKHAQCPFDMAECGNERGLSCFCSLYYSVFVPLFS